MATKIRVGQINFNETINVNNQVITNLGSPTNASDAATKQYVDNVAAGLKWKEPVKAATTSNITLSGAQTIDGVYVSPGDRVLVKNQDTKTQNGIYVVKSNDWERAEDADTGGELVSAAVFVMQGDANADLGFVCTNNEIIIGSTEITFVTFTTTGGMVAGNGIEISGSTISVKPATNGAITVNSNGVSVAVKTNGGIEIGPNGLQIDNMVVQALSDYVVQSFTGNGSSTAFTLYYKPYYASASNNNVIVTLNGIVQKQGTNEDYTVDANNRQIVFSSAPVSGDSIIVYYVKHE